MLLVHGVANPVLFLCAADTIFRSGHMDRLDRKLFGVPAVCKVSQEQGVLLLVQHTVQKSPLGLERGMGRLTQPVVW